MQQDLELKASGLYLDPSPHSDVPPGALKEALNVVIRRAGVIERRPGFEDMALSYSGEIVTGLIPYSGGLVQATNARVRNASGTAVTPAIDAGDGFQGASYGLAKKNLYLPGANATFRMESDTATTASRHGVPRGRQGDVSDSGQTQSRITWLADGGAVAYRCLYRVDVNGIPVLGAPSGRMFYENTEGSTVAPSLSLYLPAEAAAGWKVLVYRSETTTGGVTPSDELALAIEYTLVAADISAGTVTLRDSTPEDERGEALYTNETQGGILKEGGRAPGCRVVADFQGMVFFGNVQPKKSLALQFTVQPESATAADALFDIDLDSDTSAVNATFPALASEYNGRYLLGSTGGTDVFTASTNVDANTYVTYGGASNNWTLSAAALGAATEPVNLVDVFSIEDQDTTYNYAFQDYTATTSGENLANGIIDATLLGYDELTNALDLVLAKLAASINRRQSSIVASAGGAGVLLIEEEGDSAGDLISMTVPLRFQRGMEVLDDSASVSVGGAFITITPADEEFLNRVYHSELDIPEHVPGTNWFEVGSAEEPILAMRATRRALYIFKTDGVWMLRGESPETLVLEQLDETARLLHPKAVTVMGDVVYAFTDDGLVAVTEGGVSESLSADALEKEFRLIKQNFQAEDWVGSIDAGEGLWLAAIEGEGWLLLGVPQTYTADSSQYVYCFDTKTRAWTRWTTAVEAACAGRLGARFYIGGASSGNGVVHRARQDDDESPHGDDDFTQTLSSRGSATTTDDGISWALTLASATNVAAGQWVSGDNGSKGIVTAVDGSDIDVLTTSGNWSSDSTLTFYRVVSWTVKWTARTAKHPLMNKRWGTGALSFEGLKRVYNPGLSFTSDHGNSASLTYGFAASGTDIGPEAVPFVTPRATARSAQMDVSFTGSDGASSWALTSLRLDYSWSDRRVGRRAQ